MAEPSLVNALYIPNKESVRVNLESIVLQRIRGAVRGTKSSSPHLETYFTRPTRRHPISGFVSKGFGDIVEAFIPQDDRSRGEGPLTRTINHRPRPILEITPDFSRQRHAFGSNCNHVDEPNRWIEKLYEQGACSQES
jgi:hypothetical protein